MLNDFDCVPVSVYKGKTSANDFFFSEQEAAYDGETGCAEGKRSTEIDWRHGGYWQDG